MVTYSQPHVLLKRRMVVPYDTVVHLTGFLGIPEEACRVWKILCTLEETTRDPEKMKMYLESQGYTVTDVSACMTAIHRIHTRGACVRNRRIDSVYRAIVTAVHAVADTDAHVDPWVLYEFKRILWGVARDHALLYVRAGYDMSPASVVAILLCACHDYLFRCKSHDIMNLFLFESFLAVVLTAPRW